MKKIRKDVFYKINLTKMFKKSNILIACTVLFILPLSSCYVTRKYERPKMTTENLYRTDNLADSVSLTTDSTSMAELSWRNLFTDTLLKQYIDTALNNNIDVRIALQNINIAAAYVKQSKAEFAPALNGSLDITYTKNSKNSALGRINNGSIGQFQLGANLSWEADIWGKIKAQEQADQAAYLQSIEAQRAIKTRLVAAVATTYYQLMMLDAQINITKASIKSRDSSLLTTKALKEAGQLTAVAVKQTEAQLYQAKLILINLKQQERVLENALCLLLNEPSHPIKRGILKEQSINTPLKIGVPADLLANRPDVREAEYGLIQAFELTNVAKSNFYPSLTITASGGIQSTDLTNWFSLNSLFSSIAGGLLQPILNHRQIRTQYEVAQSQQQQSLLRYQQVLLTSGNEVSNALYDYQLLSQSIALQEKQSQAYLVAVNYSEQLLINGRANYLEVLTARQNVLSTQLDLANARFERLASIIQLYEALGGGWR
jgi:NodT family efflux transporter outer membrane factor (OMF) lipoprotein